MQKIKNYFHFAQSLSACLFYGFPAKKLTVIGVTGTDGKTTTSNLIYHLLKEEGYKVAVISTIGAYVNGKLLDTGLHVTTPTGFALQKIIKTIQKEDCTHLVLEITSHALDQNRAFGIPIDIGVITNITHEHLDYHKTFQRYQNTKLKLFKNTRVSVLNADDPSFDYFKIKLSDKKLVTYSTRLKNVDFNPEKAGLKGDDFNTSNQLAAISVLSEITNGSYTNPIKSIDTFQLPEGRQEYVFMDSFSVMVDFAHTPNSIELILAHLRPKVKGRIIHVFGSAGERDATKRPLMGAASSKYSDVIVLTSEDPRYEDAGEICEDIAKGIKSSFIRKDSLDNKSKNMYVIIPDRRDAIRQALNIALEGDFVLVSGKGHEKSMNIMGIENPWSDKETVLSFL